MRSLGYITQLLGDSNPFYLHEKQKYYLYTKEPFSYSFIKGTLLEHLSLLYDAKQGVEPRTTVHETVMLPLHYFAIPFIT